MTDSKHRLIIGVDGGGTGCRAAIGTPANGMLGRGNAGRANATSDLTLAVESITDAVASAAQRADITADKLSTATAHIGIAGVLTTQDSKRIAAALPYQDITVTDDRPTAVVGALGEASGGLLSVGTGTITALQTPGSMVFSGGWGFQVSDQGSGAWLGRATLERVLLCCDNLFDHTPLTRSLLSHFQDDPNNVAAFAASARAGDFATFSPQIVAHAHDADPWGQSIMQTGANHLTHGLATLGFEPGQLLCLTGGVGPYYKPFLPEGYLAGYAEAQGTSLDGAFALAKAHQTNLKGTP